MKYRKKPVVIEAWKWTQLEDQEECPSWVGDALYLWPEIGGVVFEPDHTEGPRACIASLEGVMVVSPGDWIIKGVKGELYPCKPDIFELTYEEVVPNPDT